jgi:hypothetical protein
MRLLFPVLVLAVAIAPTQARAALTTLSQFDPSGASDLCGIATDGETGAVWVHGCFAVDIQRYSDTGTFLSAVPRPGESVNDVDVEIAPVPLTLGDTPVPAGAILFINGETGPADIYAVDGITGAVLETVITDFGVGHVVGGAFHPSRGTFFLIQDRVPGSLDRNRVAEIDPTTGGVLNTFSVSTYFDVNYGDIDVCGSSGNLFLVSSIEARVAEITADGDFVQYHDLPPGVSGLSGIGHDDRTGNAWVGGTDGNAWLLGGLPCDVVSAAPHGGPHGASLTARPNPARSQVTIHYALPSESFVEVSVHDVSGRRIHAWVDGLKSAGPHETVWSARDGAGSRVPPGVYFYTVRAGSWKARGVVVLVD